MRRRSGVTSEADTGPDCGFEPPVTNQLATYGCRWQQLLSSALRHQRKSLCLVQLTADD